MNTPGISCHNYGMYAFNDKLVANVILITPDLTQKHANS